MAKENDKFGKCEVCRDEMAYPTGEIVKDEDGTEREKYLCLHHDGEKSDVRDECPDCPSDERVTICPRCAGCRDHCIC